jgi:hypothetical protein
MECVACGSCLQAAQPRAPPEGWLSPRLALRQARSSRPTTRTSACWLGAVMPRIRWRRIVSSRAAMGSSGSARVFRPHDGLRRRSRYRATSSLTLALCTGRFCTRRICRAMPEAGWTLTVGTSATACPGRLDHPCSVTKPSAYDPEPMPRNPFDRRFYRIRLR